MTNYPKPLRLEEQVGDKTMTDTVKTIQLGPYLVEGTDSFYVANLGIQKALSGGFDQVGTNLVQISEDFLKISIAEEYRETDLFLSIKKKNGAKKESG